MPVDVKIRPLLYSGGMDGAPPHNGHSDDDRVGRRRSARKYLQAQVQFGRNGRRMRVRLIDLSRHGARLSLIQPLNMEDTFWIALPGLAPISARVSWANGFIIGCEFDQPLHETTFDTLMDGRKTEDVIDRRMLKRQR